MHPRLIHTVLCLVLLLIGASGAARASPTADMPEDRDEWETIAREMILRPEFEALPLQIRWPPAQAGGGSPMEVEVRSGQCLLQLRTLGHPVVPLLLAKAAPENRRWWMRAMVAHEIAHCWRWQNDTSALHQLAHLTGHAGTDPRAARQAARQRQREEAFADVAALAWVWRVAPSQFGPMLEAFQRLRSDLRLSVGPHDTRLALERVRREGFAPGLAPFDAASALLETALADSGHGGERPEPHPGTGRR